MLSIESSSLGHHARVLTALCFCLDENVQELAVELVQLGFISEVSGVYHDPADSKTQSISSITATEDVSLTLLSVYFRATSHDLHPFLKRPSQSFTAGMVLSIR